MHTFKNFKNFADVEIDLSKPMTLLIGRNGSGKSNLIEGVELLAELLKGRAIEDITDIERGGEFEIRGGLQGCFQQKHNDFQIGFRDTVFVSGQEKKLEYKIKFGLHPFISIINKSAFIEEKDLINLLREKVNSPPVFHTEKRKHTKNKYKNDINSLSSRTNAPNIGINKNSEPSSNEIILFLKIAADLGLPIETAGTRLSIAFAIASRDVVNQKNNNRKVKKSEQFKSNELKYEISRYLAYPSEEYSIASSFDIYPRVMRQYSPIGLKKLSKNASNLSSILYYLSQNAPDVLDKILARIKQLPEEAFESFEFITTSDNSDVLFALKHPNGDIISAKLLSDGTLRAIAILTALETVPKDSRVIIEEIDNGVHPSRTKILIDAIWEASNRRNLKTLITTHNSATLDGLSDEQLDCVVVCHHDKESQSAKLTPLLELPRADTLINRGLGNAVKANRLEKHLQPDYEKKQREAALEWLETLDV